MYNGIIVYDKKDSEYNSWFINKLIAGGKSQGLSIELVLTEDIAKAGDKPKQLEACIKNYEIYDFAIVRNRNPHIANSLEQLGLRCFNRSEVVCIGNDKWRMYQFFKGHIPVMHTQRTKLPYPFVLKPVDGHGGENVYYIDNEVKFERVKAKIWDEYVSGRYIYQLPASEKGRDIRVYVLGGNILAAMERTSASDFRANFSLGGEAAKYTLSSEELSLVIKAASLINPDFVGIDLIYNNGKPVVNEIEDAVGTRMLYKYTDIDAAEEYIRYIKDSLEGKVNDKAIG